CRRCWPPRPTCPWSTCRAWPRCASAPAPTTRASPGRPVRLAFVSPRFLFPADEGGKIRTGQVLRGMRGGSFGITLLAPAPPPGDWQAELDGVCDRFVPWPPQQRCAAHKLTRLRHLLGPLPIPVATDRHEPARRVIADTLAEGCDVVVFD